MDCISKNPMGFEKTSVDLIDNCWILKKIPEQMEDVGLKQRFQNRIILIYLSAFYKGKLTSRKY